MIIVRLRGGLGNQLFQYAAGFALAKHHHVALKFDLYYYKRHQNRSVDLRHFPIRFEEATRREVHSFTGLNPVKRFINKRENYLHCPAVFAQPHFHFVDRFFDIPPPVYLSGYWTSERYFAHLREELIAQFGGAVEGMEDNRETIMRLQDQNSVALHVRRGDYVRGPYSLFAPLQPDYYERAVNWMKSKLSKPIFFIFSDDIDWCRQHLRMEGVQYISQNRGQRSYLDLILMQNCKHNIIANSTFSWWGAWLNNNPEKLVVAPSRWFARDYIETTEVVYPYRFYDTRDLLPSSWITL